MDDQGLGGLGNVPFAEQVFPQCFKIGGAVLPVIVPQGVERRGEGLLQGQLRVEIFQDVGQGALGEQPDPPVPPLAKAGIQGNLSLGKGHMEALDPLNR